MEVTYDALKKRVAELEAALQKQGCARDQATTQYCADVVERDRRIAELETQLQEAKLKLERNRSISQYKDDGFGGYPMQYDYHANR